MDCSGARGGGPAGPNADTRMQDGRHITDWRPRSVVRGTADPVGNSFQLKEQMMQDAATQMQRDRLEAAHSVGLPLWTEQETMLKGFDDDATECDFMENTA